jgi:hypothetical protein
MHVPKAGGTSIEAWLRESYPLSFHSSAVAHRMPVVPQHAHGELIEYLFAPDFFDYSFAVVRNPYRRALSEYNYRMDHRRRRDRLLPRPSFGRWVRWAFRRYRHDRYLYSNHIRPQCEFVLKTTAAFRLEDGLDDLRSWLEAIVGAAPTGVIPFHNRSKSLETQIDPATAELIAEFYARDFAAFGYARESYRD